jgi:hypothetical protein
MTVVYPGERAYDLAETVSVCPALTAIGDPSLLAPVPQ